MIRDYNSYLENISTLSDSTQEGFINAYKNWIKFGQEIFNVNEQDRYDILQSWINKNHKVGLAPRTIRTMYSMLNGFFYYMGVKISPQDSKRNLKFPKGDREERYPLTMDEIKKLIDASDYKLKGKILGLTSSGMRNGEFVRIRKKHLTVKDGRIIIHIPAKLTKTRVGRTVILSKEATKFVNLSRLDDEDLVWGTNDNYKSSRMTLIQAFHRARKKAGLDQKYENVNRHLITPHTLRSFFISKGNKVEFGFGHALAGHDYYMKVYDRYTLHELIELYEELEPFISSNNTALKDREIKKLREANRVLSDMKEDGDWLMKMARVRDEIV